MAVPRYGGLALAIGFGILAVASFHIYTPIGQTSVSARLALLFGSLAMFGLGFWDDIKPIGAKVKLLGRSRIATAVYAAGIQIELFKNPLTNRSSTGAFSYCATVAWLVR